MTETLHGATKSEQDEATIAYLTAEVAGYQRLLTETQQADPGTTVFLAMWDGRTVKVFGVDPGREQAFAETIAQYLNLVETTAEYLRDAQTIADLRSALVNIKIGSPDSWVRAEVDRALREVP